MSRPIINPKIIVIDDSPETLLIIEKTLEKEFSEIEIITFSDPVQGMEKLDMNEFNIILMDLNMPGKYGDTLLREIMKNNSGNQVIIISADTKSVTAVNCLRDGARYFLRKPLNPDKLKEVIHHCLYTYEHWEELLQSSRR